MRMQYVDAIEEVKTTCQVCNKKAVYNLKHVDGKADINGPVVQLGNIYFVKHIGRL